MYDRRPQVSATRLNDLERKQRHDSATIMPSGAIVGFYLTAADVADTTKFDDTGLGVGNYDGWAICNGENGTPDLDGRYMRLVTSGGGDLVGSDSSAHTHAVDHDHGSFTSGAEAAHTHAVDHDHGSFNSGAEAAHTHAVDHDHASFNSGAEAAHVHAPGILVQAGAAGPVAQISDPGTSHLHTVDVPAFAGASGAGSSHLHAVDVPAIVAASGAGSSHTHAIDVPSISATSGAASVTDNRPASVEVVPLMRL